MRHYKLSRILCAAHRDSVNVSWWSLMLFISRQFYVAHFEVYYNPPNPGNLIEFLWEFRYTHHQRTSGGKPSGILSFSAKWKFCSAWFSPLEIALLSNRRWCCGHRTLLTCTFGIRKKNCGRFHSSIYSEVQNPKKKSEMVWGKKKKASRDDYIHWKGFIACWNVTDIHLMGTQCPKHFPAEKSKGTQEQGESFF